MQIVTNDENFRRHLTQIKTAASSTRLELPLLHGFLGFRAKRLKQRSARLLKDSTPMGLAC